MNKRGEKNLEINYKSLSTTQRKTPEESVNSLSNITATRKINFTKDLSTPPLEILKTIPASGEQENTQTIDMNSQEFVDEQTQELLTADLSPQESMDKQSQQAGTINMDSPTPTLARKATSFTQSLRLQSHYGRILGTPSFLRNAILLMARSAFKKTPLFRIPFQFLDQPFLEYLHENKTQAIDNILYLLCDYFEKINEQEERHGYTSPDIFKQQSGEFQQSIFNQREIFYQFLEELQKKQSVLKKIVSQMKVDTKRQHLSYCVQFLPHILKKLLQSLRLTKDIQNLYRNFRKIGQGKHGTVYLAEIKNSLGETRTIKLFSPTEAKNIDNLECFLFRANLAMELRHRNLECVTNYGGYVRKGQYYIETKYVKGIPLQEWIKSYPWENAQNHARYLEILIELCEVLQYIHGRNLTHNNIKLSNVIVGQESVKLFDFAMPSNNGYTDPEKTLGDNDWDSCDRRTDLYSLGVLMYKMFSQSSPCKYEGKSELCEHVAYFNLPLWLKSLMIKLLQKQASKRLDSAGAVKWILQENHPRRSNFFIDIIHDLQEELHGKSTFKAKSGDKILLLQEETIKLRKQLEKLTGKQYEDLAEKIVQEKRWELAKKELADLKNIPPFLADRCPNRECTVVVDKHLENCHKCGTTWKIACPECGKLTHIAFNNCQHAFPTHQISFEEKIIYSAIVTSRYCCSVRRYLTGLFYLRNVERSLLSDAWLKAEQDIIYQEWENNILTELNRYKKNLLEQYRSEEHKAQERLEKQRQAECMRFLKKIKAAVKNEQYLHALETLDKIPSNIYNAELRKYREKVCSYLCKNYLQESELLCWENKWEEAIFYLKAKIPSHIRCKSVELKIREIEGQLTKIIQRQVEELIKNLGNKDDRMRGKAEAQLAKIGRPAVAKVILLLRNNDWKIRKAAIHTLEKMKEKASSAVPMLLENVKNQKWWVREAIAESLEKLGSYAASAIPVLTEMLDDENWVVRKAVAYAFGEIPLQDMSVLPKLIDMVNDKVWIVKLAAVETLGKIGYKAAYGIPELVKTLSDPSVQVKTAAAYALGNMGERACFAIQDLIQLLQDKNVEAKQAAAETLGKLGSKSHEAVPALVTLLRHEDLCLVEVVSEALASIGKVAIPELILMLKENVEGARLASIYALGNIGLDENSDIMALTLALKDKNWNVRKSAADALGNIGEKALCSVPALTRALKDNIWNVRIAAANALGNIGEQALCAVPALNKASYDRMANVRNATQQAIKKITASADVGSEKKGKFASEVFRKLTRYLAIIAEKFT